MTPGEPRTLPFQVYRLRPGKNVAFYPDGDVFHSELVGWDNIAKRSGLTFEDGETIIVAELNPDTLTVTCMARCTVTRRDEPIYEIEMVRHEVVR